MELSTAWIHTDWILLALLLMFSNPERRTFLLLGALILVRVCIVQLTLTFGLGLPWRIPANVLCLPIIILAWLANRSPDKKYMATVTAVAAGLLLTLYDLQFLAFPAPAPLILPVLFGYQIGFLAGLFAALSVLYPINMELKKSLQFHNEWRPRICWALAAISIWTDIAMGRWPMRG